MVRLLLLAIGLGSSSVPALAQSNPTLTEAERGIRRDGVETAHLRIDALNLTARLTGRTADVTVEMVIGADDTESYEANLALALPNDAVVTGYALDVDGRMIPGQLLEAPKARNVYEDEVRSGIDPGLAEVSGNRFVTRIFPIDATHPRRFRLQFVAPFDPVVGLVLPLARERAIGRVDASVTVAGYAAAPAIRFAGRPLTLTRSADGWKGQVSLGRTTLREGLTVSSGAPTEAMVVARHSSGETFFAIADGVGSGGAPDRSPRGGRLRIYWDRSLSHSAARTDLEAELLARLVAQTKPDAIDLVTFASDRPQTTTVTNAASLRTALERVVYRGGTSLAGLDALPLPAAARCVIVFDGAITIDRGATFSPDCRLIALTTATDADGVRLSRLVQGSSGRVIRFAAGGEAAALASMTVSEATPVSVRDAAGQRIKTRALPAGLGQWLLLGRMPAKGPVIVRLSNGSERRYTATRAPIPAEAPASLWAAMHVAELADDPARHQAMADTARRYKVAGPGMSFLVLERPDQYLRAGLQPPDGFDANWLGSYRAAKTEHDQERRNAKQERLAFVIDQWRQRRVWWNARFTPKSRGQVKRTLDNEGFDGVAPPPPPAPPAPSAPPAPPTEPVELRSVMTPPPVVSMPAPPPVEIPNGNADVIVTGTRTQLLPTAEQAPSAAIRLDMAKLISKRPYIAALDTAAPARRLAILTEQERQYGTVPTFYLDTAEWFRLKGDRTTAALLLLSALELPSSDDETRQIVAFRLERDRSFDRAVELAEQLAAANAEFRPHPGRDLALALAARGRSAGPAGCADLERAFNLLVDTALNPASNDFDGFEVIALMEANALIPQVTAAGGRWTLDRRLLGLTDTDARIVMEWTADDADIDLWVDEPNGERVMYSNKLSSAGGQISNDMTDGYGPEEYAIRRAPAGAYRVRINGFDADRINPNGAGHVLLRLQRNFARAGGTEELVDLDLSFQEGRNRNAVRNTVPVATLQVGR